MAIKKTPSSSVTFNMEGDAGVCINAQVSGGIATIAVNGAAKTTHEADVSEMFTEGECREAAKLFTMLADEIKRQDKANS